MDLGKLKPGYWNWIFVTFAFLTGFLIGRFTISADGAYSNVVIEEHVRNSLNPEITFFITAHREANPSTVCFVRLLDNGLLESWCESGVGLGFGSLWGRSDFYLDPSKVEHIKKLLSKIGMEWEPARWISPDDFVVIVSFWNVDDQNLKIFRSYSCYQGSCRAVVCSVLDSLNSVSIEGLGISKEICPG